jgi:hypothetical protein
MDFLSTDSKWRDLEDAFGILSKGPIAYIYRSVHEIGNSDKNIMQLENK